MMRILSVSALAIGFLFLACGDPLAPADVAGRYQLTQVNGEALPVQFSDVPPICDGELVLRLGEVVDDTLTLDNTFQMDVTLGELDDCSLRARAYAGTWTLDGSSGLTLMADCPRCDSFFSGELSGNRITVHEGSMVWTFER